MSRPVIVIDPGHGGRDSGAVGPRGTREADVNLAVALLLYACIATWAAPVLTRRDDRYLSLRQRATLANDAEAEAFVSIHCNAGGGSGYEIFTTQGRTVADVLATDLFAAIAAGFPHLRKRMDLSDGDADKEARFAVLMKTHAPAALVEMEFIDTPAGEAMLRDKKFQAAYARALASGLRKHFDWRATRKP